MNFLTTGTSYRGECFVAEPFVREEERTTVYLDTTIVSYLTASLNRDISKARRQHMTREWWAGHRVRYDLYISSHVTAEAAAGNCEEARKRLEVLAPIRLLTETDESLQIVEHLMERRLLPQKARADAEHISIAAVHSVRILLTWNCKHLANEKIARDVARMCESLGYRCPNICTPEKLMRTFAHERSLA
jgi:hypothetical protein